MMIKKKPFVIISLIILLFVVGILNYKYGMMGDDLAGGTKIDKEGPINSKLVENADEEDIMAGSKNISKEFFIEYRLERDKNRSQHIGLLENIVSNKETDKDTRGEAQNQMINLVKLSEKEMIIENLIRAKGFNDVIVFIHDGYVNAIVDSEELSPGDAAQIQDIIFKETGVSLDKISIANTK
ncbi:MAG TPA: SpoIIIAH-like family protein [Eubacteriaceae bacterium]|jgi:stage III sporulation protein AH|nr:SpoIIIAH-like family protein [Eubacteriaceae bacterium]